jgi:transposase
MVIFFLLTGGNITNPGRTGGDNLSQWSSGMDPEVVAAEFNATNPTRKLITHSAVRKLVKKYTETGSVADKSRCGRPSVSGNIRIYVIAKYHTRPRKSIRRTSPEIGVPKITVYNILKKEKFHPYKLQILHRLTEDDPNLEMCEWFLSQAEERDCFLEGVMFSDEAKFYVNGKVNK